MAARKRRGPRHPGVVLIKPDLARRIGWRARYRDPDSGKLSKASLDPSLTTTEQREAWAVDKSKEMAKRRLELAAGAPRATGLALSAVTARYFEAHPQLRPRTLDVYRAAAAKLTDWGSANGVASADDLTRAKLLAFRESVVREKKRAPARAGKRGKRKLTERARSPHTINRELRAVRTVLGYVRDLDLLPRLSHDDLRRALKRLATTSERVEFLKAAECQKLLQAALAHDAEAFAETRDEHAGRREKGSTARYEPVAPLTAFLLLTGMRYGEAIDLEWPQVDLATRGSDGHDAGEIHLRGADVKTRKGRTIDLSVCPSLRLLLALLRQRTGGKGKVFALTRGHADAAVKRLRAEYGAPSSFSWQALRRTCGCFLTNAPGIFAAASAYRSAKQLGHSVTVAERHYVDVVKGIPREARTLESAMEVSAAMVAVVSRASTQV